MDIPYIGRVGRGVLNVQITITIHMRHVRMHTYTCAPFFRFVGLGLGFSVRVRVNCQHIHKGYTRAFFQACMGFQCANHNISKHMQHVCMHAHKQKG